MAEFSPSELRIDGIARFVVHHRDLGRSDATIRKMLTIQGNLDRLHPCADFDGLNICRSTEIDSGFRKAAGYKEAFDKAKAEAAAKKEAASVGLKGGFPWWVVGAALGLGFILWRRRS